MRRLFRRQRRRAVGLIETLDRLGLRARRIEQPVAQIGISVRDESGSWHEAVIGTGDADGFGELLKDLAARRDA